MKKAFRKMLAVLMALTMIVANFAIIAVNAEEGHAHAEGYKCPGVDETGNPKEHDLSNCDWTKGATKAPTCGNAGYTIYTCKGCNTPFVADIVPADEDTTHVFTGDPVVTPAKCGENGEGKKVWTCSVCGAKKTETIPALKHNFVVDGDGCKCTNEGCQVAYSHDYVNLELKSSMTAPSKTAQGTAVFACKYCGTEKTVPVSKICDETHEWIFVPYKEASCTEEGTTGHIYCATCKEAFFKKTVDKAPHQYGAYTTDKAATCTEDGTEKAVCGVCKGETTRPVKATGHNYIKDGKKESDATSKWDENVYNVAKHQAPTCLKNGWVVYQCTKCEHYTDAFIVDPLGHDYDDPDKEGKNDSYTEDWTSCTEGERTWICQNDDCDIEDNPKTEKITRAHDVKTHAAKAPACGVAGWTEGQYCARCSGYQADATSPVGATVTGEWIKAPEAKEALVHTYVKADGSDNWKTDRATCMTVSETYRACIYCGAREKNPADDKVKYGTEFDTTENGHVWGEVVHKDPTCTTPGTKKVWCEKCHKVDGADIEIPATGHNYDANKDGKVDKEDGVVTTTADCTTKEVRTFTCVDCQVRCANTTAGHVHDATCGEYTVTYDALGHDWDAIDSENARVDMLPEDCKTDGHIAAICKRGTCGALATAADNTATKTVYKTLKADPAKHHKHNVNLLYDYPGDDIEDGGVARVGNCQVKALYRYLCDVCDVAYTLEGDFGPCETPAKLDKADYEDLFCNWEDLVDKVIADCDRCGAYYEVVDCKDGSACGAADCATKYPNGHEHLVKLYTNKDTLPEGKTADLILHNLKEYAADAYDCMDAGWDKYVKCENTDCDYNKQVYVPAYGHDFVKDDTTDPITLNVVNDKSEWEPTCTTPGYKVVACLKCGELVIVDYKPATGHTYAYDNDVVTGIMSCKDEKFLALLDKYNVKPEDAKCYNNDREGHAIHAAIGCNEDVHTCDGIYDIYYCTAECGYTYTETVFAYPAKLHELLNMTQEELDEVGFTMTPDIYYEIVKFVSVEGSEKLVAPATANKPARYSATCKFCLETFEYYKGTPVEELTFDYDFYAANEDFEIFDPIYEEYDDEYQPLLSVDDEDGYYWDMPITNGGIIAVVITTNSPGVEVNSIGLKLEYDAERLEFIKGEVTNDKFNLANCRVNGNNKTGEDTYATLTVLAVTEDGNIGLNGEEELAIAYFRVLTQKGDDNADFELWIDMWDSERSEVLNEDGDDVDFEVESYEEYWVYKLGDLNYDERIGLADINEMALMIDLDYEGEYYTYADINRDGVVDIFDYELLVDYYLEIIDYLEFCGN